MVFALKNGSKYKATEKRSAMCPACHQPVFGVSHNDVEYWSHMYQVNCDPWASDETRWSISWKKQFQPSCVDIPVVKTDAHLADILTGSGIVMKLCFTVFPKITIRENESFFGERMIWIIDALPLGITTEKGSQEKFVITLPQLFSLTKWHESKRPLFFDINETELLYFESGADFELRVGRVIEKERFLRKYNS